MTPSSEALEALFTARCDGASFSPRYNAAPSQSLPAILNTDPHTVTWLAGGLKPAWAQSIGKREGIINVRTETLCERQLDRIHKAKERGVHFSRTKQLNTQQITALQAKRKKGTLSKTLMKDYNLSKASVYCYRNARSNSSVILA